MRVLIFQPDFGGHRLLQAARLVRGVHRLGCQVVLAIARPAIASEAYGLHLAGDEEKFSLVLLDDLADARWLSNAGKLRRAFRRCVAELKIDHAYVADRELWAHFHAAKPGSAEVELYAQTDQAAPGPLGVAPTLSRDDARRWFHLPVDGRAVGIVGVIESKHGVAELASAMRENAPQLNAHDRLQLVGRVHPDVHRLLDGPVRDLVRAGRIVVVDRALSAVDLANAIAASDAIAAIESQTDSQWSILPAAVVVGRPVLASGHAEVGRTVRQFEMGSTFDPTREFDLAEKMLDTLNRSRTYAPTPAAQRLAEYFGEASGVAHWTARLRQRLGRAASPDLRTWQWVSEGDVQQPMRRAA